MGIAERKKRRKAELREQILEAAWHIVATEGLDALTIRKIADAIEYAPGTIYLHFESRDEIARQLVREGFDELIAFLTPAARVADPRERLRALGRGYVAFGLQRPEVYRVIFMQPPHIATTLYDLMGDPKAPDDPGARAFSIIEATVRELVDTGVFRKLDPTVIAETIWAWAHGIVALALLCDKHESGMLTDVNASIELMTQGVERAFAAA